MSNVQRWYIYAISTISLQAVTWAIISLLRNLLVFGIEPESAAFQIAVILIGVPVFLAHWLWGGRLAKKSIEEYGIPLRRSYLFTNMAGFLEPFISNAYVLIRRLLGGIGRPLRPEYSTLSLGDAVVFHLVALVVLAIVWFYHWQVTKEHTKLAPDVGGTATVRRVYVLGFSAAGLILTTLALVSLIQWLFQGIRFAGKFPSGLLIDQIPRLMVGVVLWLVFWRWAQRLFDGPSEEEQLSALRKSYLYAIAFISSMLVVTSASGILASLIRRWLSIGQPASENVRSDLSMPLAIIIGLGVLWIYHALVLREDTKKAGEALRQAEIRRLYLYLIAGVGFAALLVGVSGVINIILRSLDQRYDLALRGDYAWFIAATIAGLPVWIISWRQAQDETTKTDLVGKDAIRSVARRNYLYFYLFAATVTVLYSAVDIVSRILSMVFGKGAPTLTVLGQSISYVLIAIAVWLYHNSLLRGDRRSARSEQAGLLAALHVVVVDVGEGLFGRALVEQLRRIMPELSLEPIILAPAATETGEQAIDQKPIAAKLSQAGLIVAPWIVTLPGGAEGAVSPEVAQAIHSSPARKLLVPLYTEGWEWVGVDRWNFDTSVRQSVNAVKQVLAGEDVKAHRSIGAGAAVGITLGVLFLLILLAIMGVNYY